LSACFHYAAFGLRIGSELELPCLPLSDGEPDINIRLGWVDSPIYKANDDLHVIVNNLAGKFQLNRGREIVVDALPGADPEAVRVILLGSAMAGLLRQRGWLPLHASGIVIDGRAILFLGPSGAGKSTAAAALHVRGHSVVTDDVGAVQTVDGQCRVRRGLSRLRLLDLSVPFLDGFHSNPVFQFDKYALRLSQPDLPVTLPVGRIYILDFGADLSPHELKVEELSPLLGMASLSMHSFFRRRTFEKEAVRSHVRACAELAEALPIRQILRPKSLLSIPDLIRLVEADAARG
jgi:hypothetical protein